MELDTIHMPTWNIETHLY